MHLHLWDLHRSLLEVLWWHLLLNRERDVVLASLGGKHALSVVSVAFALAILLVGVLNRDLLVSEVLAVHVLDRLVRRLEVGEGNKSVTLGKAIVVVSNLRASVNT